MLDLVNQNKKARKHAAILQVTTTWRSYIFASYPKVTWCHINLFRYINTHTFIQENSRHVAEFVGRSLEIFKTIYY